MWCNINSSIMHDTYACVHIRFAKCWWIINDQYGSARHIYVYRYYVPLAFIHSLHRPYEYVFWKLTHFSFSLNLWKELISNSFERMTMMTTGNEGLYLFIYSVCSFLSFHISHENHSVCFGRKRTHTKKMILNQMHQRFSEVRLFSTFVLKTFVFWSQPRSVVASTFSNKWSHLSSATEFFSINIRLCYLMGIRAILLLLCSDGTLGFVCRYRISSRQTPYRDYISTTQANPDTHVSQ